MLSWIYGTFLPLTALIIFSILILYKIHHQKKTRKRMTSKWSANKTDIKVAINVISIALAYVLLYVPTSVLGVIVTYFPLNLASYKLEKILDIFSVYCTIAMGLNSLVDAFVFVCVSRRFRAVLYQMLRCNCRHK